MPHEIGRINPEILLRRVTDYRRFIAWVQTAAADDLTNEQEPFEPAIDDGAPNFVDRYSSVWTLKDSNKEFIISGDKWLVIETFVPCTAYLKIGSRTLQTESIPTADRTRHQSFFEPIRENVHAMLTFNWKLEREGAIRRQWQQRDYPILSVPSGRKLPRFDTCYPLTIKKQPLQKPFTKVLLANPKGALSLFPALPGAIDSKYDVLLAVSESPDQPTQRIALAKWMTETVQVGQKFFDLDGSFLQCFSRYPNPTWKFVYDDGEYSLHLEKSMVMDPDQPALMIQYHLRQSNAPVKLFAKCAVEHRDWHHPSPDRSQHSQYVQYCKKLSAPDGICFQPDDRIQLRITTDNGRYIEQPHWIEGLYFAQDDQRKLDAHADAFIPGIFNFELHSQECRTLRIAVENDPAPASSYSQTLTRRKKYVRSLAECVPVESAKRDKLVRIMIQALDQFITQTPDGVCFSAGYPWLGMRVLDVLWSVPGLLAAGRIDDVCNMIIRCARTEENGLLLDWIYGGPTQRTSLEASLRLFSAARHVVDYTGSDQFYDTDLGNGRTLREVLVSIYEHLLQSTPDGIAIDHDSGLIYSPPGFSWMNTDYPRATPRAGYCIEHQLLWKQALDLIGQLYPPARRQTQSLIERIENNFIHLFWNQHRGYCADVLLAPAMLPARQASADMALRPNQIEALATGVFSPERTRNALSVIARKLVIPGAVRSLSEDPLTIPLRIRDAYGNILVDPRLPYVGRCEGDETARRLAYHNGSAWPMMYARFVEASAAAWHFSRSAIHQALALWGPLPKILAESAIGSIPEMKDGNFPHTPRGCAAYAPAVAETLRVYLTLKHPKTPLVQPDFLHPVPNIAP